MGANSEITPFDRADRAWKASEAAFRENRSEVQRAWEFGRASFDRAEFSTSSKERAAIAEPAIAACRGAAVSNPTNAPTLYYLALNLGQLARTKSLGALKIVREMEELFLRVRALDPEFDHAGADRCLGLLYLEAPSWPTSIGNKAKAREFLQQATDRVPWYPTNALELGEAGKKWRDNQLQASALAVLVQNRDTARSRLTGETWEEDWKKWGARTARLEQGIRLEK